MILNWTLARLTPRGRGRGGGGVKGLDALETKLNRQENNVKNLVALSL